MIFDIETVAIDDAATYIEPVSAPSNYRDEDKIAAYIRKAERDQLAKAALDPDLCRIVAIGWAHSAAEVPRVALFRNEEIEQAELEPFWRDVREAQQVIGFGCIGFDIPVLIRRSQYLGVRPALSAYDLNKYRMSKVQDVLMHLSFTGAQKYHSLEFYCQRFGISVEDEIRGADIATLYAEEDWAGIRAHCAADVQKTAKLARRIGVLD